MKSLVPWIAPLSGGLWIALGSAKIGDTRALSAYLSQHVGIGGRLADVFALGSAFAEVAVGVLMFRFGSSKPRGARWGFVLWGAVCLAVGAIIATLAWPADSRGCGCFGSIVRATNSRRLIVAGAQTIAASVLMQARGERSSTRLTGDTGVPALIAEWTSLGALAASIVVLLVAMRSAHTIASLPVVDASIAESVPARPTEASLASVPGGARADVGATLEPPTEPLGVPRAAPLDGLVEAEADGVPVAGATLVAETRGPLGAEPLRGPPTLSDTHGEFRVESPERRDGSVVQVACFAPGFVVSRSSVDVGRRTVIRLARGVAIAGRVVSAPASGIAGVRVIARPPGALGMWPAIPEKTPVELGFSGSEAFTDAQGRFVLRGLLDSTTYRIVASKRGFAESSDPSSAVVRSAPSDGVVIQLQPRWDLEYRIVPTTRVGEASRFEDVRIVAPAALSVDGDGTLAEQEARLVSVGAAGPESNAGWHWVPFSAKSDASADTAGRHSVTIVVRALGFRSVTRTVDLVHGETARETIELEPERGSGTPRPVHLLARTRDGRTFTGALQCFVQRDRDGSRAFRSTAGFDAAGRSLPREMPPDVMTVRLEGIGEESGLLSPACLPTRFDVSGVLRDGEVNVTIIGNPIELVDESRDALADAGFIATMTSAESRRFVTIRIGAGSAERMTPAAAGQAIPVGYAAHAWVSPGRYHVLVASGSRRLVEQDIEADGSGAAISVRFASGPTPPR